MGKSIFKGVATALYTPFNPKDLSIDYVALKNLIERQISGGVDALVLLGTTGESPTVTERERIELIEFASKEINKRVPLIIGCGSNCTRRASENIKQAEKKGCDGALVVTPYYNKCNQDGLIAHYNEIASTTNLPILIYEVPSRTGIKIEIETYEKLLELPNVAGIKEADENETRYKAILKNFSKATDVYCGIDEKFTDFLSLGSSGIISVTSNIIPNKIKEIYLDFKDYYKKENTDVSRLNSTLFSDVNPIMVKCAAEILFGEGYGLRLPLTQASTEKREFLRQTLKSLNIEVN